MGLVKDAKAKRIIERSIAPPIKRIVDDDAFWVERSIILVRKREVPIRQIRVETHRRGDVPCGHIGQRFGVGIQNHLVRIEPESFFRYVRSVNAIKVKGPRREAPYMAMPDITGPILVGIKVNLFHRTGTKRRIEERERYRCRMTRKKRKIDSLVGELGAEG
jgi:hypothetical protein